MEGLKKCCFSPEPPKSSTNHLMFTNRGSVTAKKSFKVLLKSPEVYEIRKLSDMEQNFVIFHSNYTLLEFRFPSFASRVSLPEFRFGSTRSVSLAPLAQAD